MKNKKIIIIIGVVLLIAIILVVMFCLNGYIPLNGGNGKTTGNNYDTIKKLFDDKEKFIIYYYNSTSDDKNNLKIKAYLDELNINYYEYDNANVDKEEYSKFLTLVNIPEDVFGMPALIYVNNGKMWSNLINIDNNKVVKRFIDDHDLYIVK